MLGAYNYFIPVQHILRCKNREIQAAAEGPVKSMNMEKADAHLAISFLALFLPLVLYLSRNIDDNRLTSWSWVFTAAHPGLLFVALIVIIVALHLLADRLPAGNSPLFLVFASLLVCPLFWSAPEVIVDASRYFAQAKQLNEYGFAYFFREWGRGIFAWTDLPLIPFLYGLAFKLFGENRIIIQLLNATMFSMSTLLVYVLGKELWDEKTGFHGGLLLLGFPFLFTQVPLMLVDVGTMFFLLLAMVAMYRAVARGGPFSIILAASAIFCTVFVKYSAWILLTVMVPIFFSAMSHDRRKCLIRAFMVIIPSLAGICAVCWFHQDVMIEQVALLNEYQRPGLRRWGENLISTFFFQTHPLLTLAALFSVFRAWRNRDRRWLVPAYLIVVLLVFLEIRRSRYSIPLFPLVALLAAYGIRDPVDPKLARHLVAAIVLPSVLLAWGAFLPFLKNMDERNIEDAGAYLDTLQPEHIQVLAINGASPLLDQRVYVLLLDLFTHKKIKYKTTTNPEADPASIAVSSLRFTWEFPIPSLYLAENAHERSEVTVVISDREHPVIPMVVGSLIGDVDTIKRFSQNSGVFQNRIVVTIYHHAKLP